MKTVNIKVAFVLSIDESQILVSGSAGKIQDYEAEISKVKTKLLVAVMKPEERKRVPSPDHGKWQCYCNHQKLIFAVCIPGTYSERLSNQILDVKFRAWVRLTFSSGDGDSMEESDRPERKKQQGQGHQTILGHPDSVSKPVR